MDDDICSICHKPILLGEGRYTAGEHKGIFRHWDCYKPALDEFDALVASLGPTQKTQALRSRKAPCRPGDGPVARRLARKIVKAIKRDLGYDVEPEALEFWVQAPIYRGPRWDLAGWGCNMVHPEHPNLTISFHSWDSMSRLVKQDEVTLYQDGSLSYDVG